MAFLEGIFGKVVYMKNYNVKHASINFEEVQQAFSEESKYIYTGCPSKNVHDLLEQVSPDSVRVPSHEKNKLCFIKIGQANQKLYNFLCSQVKHS